VAPKRPESGLHALTTPLMMTQSGWMSAAQLYESPFTDFSPKGVEGVFGPEQVLQMVGILNDIRERAAV
jgi:type I restriction enzyme R subunit